MGEEEEFSSVWQDTTELNMLDLHLFSQGEGVNSSALGVTESSKDSITTINTIHSTVIY